MFRKELPRTYELLDLIGNPDSVGSCFHDFDKTLQNPLALAAWRTLENELQELDSAAWKFLREEASAYLAKWDGYRGREQLLNIINQARAYHFLKNKGYTDIHFIPRCPKTGVRTPDLEGVCGSGKVICEVKTINPSDAETLRRQKGNYLNDEPLASPFFDKLMSTITDAEKQIEAFDPSKEARHVVYIIPNFDDFWMEYNRKEEYFRQIDHHLSQNVASGIEIVFHNQKTPFHKKVTMNCATVVNDE